MTNSQTSAAASEKPVPVAKISPRTLIGYSNVTSVRAGDRVDFMVNVMDGGFYEADLVRIINGDGLSRKSGDECIQTPPIPAPRRPKDVKNYAVWLHFFWEATE